MNRKELKSRAKEVFNKQYWKSVIIAFIMLLGAGGSVSVVNFNINLTGSSQSSGEAITPDNIKEALETLLGTLPDFAYSFLTIVLPIILACAFLVGMFISYFALKPLRCGGIRYFLKLRKNNPAEVSELSEHFNDKTYLNIAKASFAKDIRIILGLLLFIIPGVIRTFDYWAVEYILAVRPDIDKNVALSLSKKLMKGNKVDVFVLGLSFIGWDLLAAISVGLLNIFYINPYKEATYVEFFSYIREKAILEGKISVYDIPDYQLIQPQPDFPSYPQPMSDNFTAPLDASESFRGPSFSAPIEEQYNSENPENI